MSKAGVSSSIRSGIGLLLVLLATTSAFAQTFPEPPDEPAAVELTAGHLILRYQNAVVLDATVTTTGGNADLRQFVDQSGGRVAQAFKWTAAPGGRVTMTGFVNASPEAFAAEVEPRPEALAVVRSSSGPAFNRLNRAVYDRRFDWVVSIDFPAQATVTPAVGSSSSTRFDVTASGGELAIRFRPRYYQQHRQLREYRPWTYQTWNRSVAGWTSWFAFLDAVTEADITRTADTIGQTLRPFGYQYVQIDDGFQQTPIGMPDHWLKTNAKFPGGLAGLQRAIKDRGLEPGIWTNVSFADAAAAAAHPSWFVRGPDDKAASGNWIGFVMDASVSETLTQLVRPVYEGLKSMGWTYVKLDALRHLRYEGYNSHAESFTARGLDRAQVYRTFVRTVRDVLGPDIYLLACWGVRPELVGLVDGVRLGDDGFGYGSFAQYNSFNNVVWRNDPDHIEIGQPDGFRAATLASLTGSVLMLTDKPEVYRTDRAEAARRTAPVPVTRPGQLYDLDPSRSSRIAEADTQLSGAGPRPFDADKRLVVPRYQLDVARPFEQWTVLAITSGADVPIRLSDLGLAEDADYVGFDFWHKTPTGTVRGQFTPAAIDPAFQMDVVCLRSRVDHPQVLATNRHVTCGGADLVDVAWADRTLRGTSDVVAGDVYAVYLTEPKGYRLDSATADGATVASQAMESGMRVIRLSSAKGGRVTWQIRYVASP